MDNVGTLNEALARYDAHMKGVAHNASNQIRGYFDADDIYQDLFLLLVDCHTDKATLPLVEFTKYFYAAINSRICNLVTNKRTRNRIKSYSIDKDYDGGSSHGGTKKRSMKDSLERHEHNDESYKIGIMDVLNNVSPESGNAILDSLDPSKRGNSSIGIKEAFDEAKRYLTE